MKGGCISYNTHNVGTVSSKPFIKRKLYLKIPIIILINVMLLFCSDIACCMDKKE
jgi:hypothetical protein